MSNERCLPITIPHELVAALWRAVKDARDEAFARKQQAEHDLEEYNNLLGEMKKVGMSEWIPSLDEITKEFNDAIGLADADSQ